MLQSNNDIDQHIDHNDNFDHDHDVVDDDYELTRNNDNLLLEMENCIN